MDSISSCFLVRFILSRMVSFNKMNKSLPMIITYYFSLPYYFTLMFAFNKIDKSYRLVFITSLHLTSPSMDMILNCTIKINKQPFFSFVEINKTKLYVTIFLLFRKLTILMNKQPFCSVFRITLLLCCLIHRQITFLT